MILGTTCSLSEETREETIVVMLEGDLEGVLLNIRRASDGYFLDWNDNIFKNGGWSTIEREMPSVPTPVHNRHQYQTTWSLREIGNRVHDDVYFLEVNCDHSALTPILGEIRQGWWITLVEQIPSIPALVWVQASRTLTSFGSLVANVATAVWSVTTRTLTALVNNRIFTDHIMDYSFPTIMAKMESGLTNVLMNVRRRSDGFWLDFSDDTFKSSGWGVQDAPMTEVGTTGQYERMLLLGNVLNLTPDDSYVVTIHSATSTFSPQIGEYIAGQWVSPIMNYLDAPVSQAALEDTAQEILGDTSRMIFDSRSGPGNILAVVDWTMVLSMLGVNRRIKDVVHDTDGNLLSATVCGYANASDAQDDINPTITIAVTGEALLGFQSGLLEVES
jgi:hypothetical protein